VIPCCRNCVRAQFPGAGLDDFKQPTSPSIRSPRSAQRPEDRDGVQAKFGEDNPRIPAGWPFFGQFIAHDIAHDRASLCGSNLGGGAHLGTSWLPPPTCFGRAGRFDAARFHAEAVLRWPRDVPGISTRTIERRLSPLQLRKFANAAAQIAHWLLVPPSSVFVDLVHATT